MKKKESVKKLTAVVLAAQMAVSMVPVYAQEEPIVEDEVVMDEQNQVEETLPEEEMQSDVEDKEQLDETTESDVVDDVTEAEVNESDLLTEEIKSSVEEIAEAPVATNEIYVSQNGSGNKSGNAFENAMAVSELSQLSGDITIKIVENVSINDNLLPEARLKFVGNDESSKLTLANTIHFKGDSVFDNVTIETEHNGSIYACGHNITFTSSVKLANSNTTIYIFGGSNEEDIVGSPVITNEASLPQANIYGGGEGHTLTGNPKIVMKNGIVASLYGGGFAPYGATNAASVIGDTQVNIDGGTIGSVFGGGRAGGPNTTANVTGKASININGGTLEGSNNGIKVFAGGYAEYNGTSATTSNTEVNISSLSTTGSLEIYGGGQSCNTSGSVNNANANVETSNINVLGSFMNQRSYSYSIYGSGMTHKNNNSSTAQVENANITVRRGEVNANNLIVNGAGYGSGTDVQKAIITVDGIQNSKIFAGTNDQSSPKITSNTLQSADIKLSNASKIGGGVEVYGGSYKSSPAKLNTKLTIKGNNEIKQFHDIDVVEINNESMLEESHKEILLFDPERPNGNIVQHQNSILYLINENTLSGAYETAGTLKMLAKNKFVVQSVSSEDGALYESVGEAKKDDVFLQSTGVNSQQYAKFGYNGEGLFVSNRSSKDENITQEWYLDVETRTVTFDSNEGSPVESQTVNYNEKAVKPEDPTKEGYVFAGWYKDEKLKELYDFDTLVTENITLYAKWNLKASELNVAPTISASDKTLTVGDEFDPLKDVTATDKEDGDITLGKENVIENTVDTSKPGTYKVTYEVTDSQGAKATKTISVTVNPKMEVINAIPTIKAEDKTITVGDKFDPLKDVTAKDKEDGDITKNIKVILNAVNTTKPGRYLVTYEVTDSAGLSASKTITVTVKDKVIVDEKPNEDKPNKETDKGTNTGLSTGVGLFASLGTTALSSIGILEVLRRKNRK